MSEFQSMKHLKINKDKVSDFTLQDILDKQSKFNQQFFDARDMSLTEKETWTQMLVIAMLDELSELLGQINWKWWKKKKKIFDLIEIRYELIDLFIFLISIMELYGMDEKTIFAMYIAKNKENINRQKRGY